MSKLFQIYEQDLADLEHTLPELLLAMYSQLGKDDAGSNRLRVQWRRVQEILTNVRWNYGPPLDVKVMDGAPPEVTE